MQILLDMDGVLADFIQQACKSHDRPYIPEQINNYNISEIWGLTDDEFWAPMHGYKFWPEIEMYDYAPKFLKELRKIAPVTICTAPSRDKYCISGKLHWLESKLGIPTCDVVFANKKWLLANDRNILIDDSDAKIEKFQQHGGTGIIFPQPWNQGIGSWKTVLSIVSDYSQNKQ